MDQAAADPSMRCCMNHPVLPMTTRVACNEAASLAMAGPRSARWTIRMLVITCMCGPVNTKRSPITHKSSHVHRSDGCCKLRFCLSARPCLVEGRHTLRFSQIDLSLPSSCANARMRSRRSASPS